MILGQRLSKVQRERVRKGKGLIKHETRGQIGHEAREPRNTCGTSHMGNQNMQGTR